MSADATGRSVLTVADGMFWRGGRPHQLISGGLHYFRIHPDLWSDRLQRVAALGVNTVETYVPWNFHEKRPGTVDFTGWRDLRRFITLAAELDLDVILRPGPYICAEWDFGGLPFWLMTQRLGLRTSDPRFLSAIDRWFDAVVPQFVDLLSTRGGPIVAVQVENEYGSYGDDAGYLEHCRSALTDRGVDVLLFTSDGPGPDWLAHGTLPGVLATANFGSKVAESFAELRKFQPAGPDVCMEYWNGWFDHWGERHHVRAADDAAQVLAEMLNGGAGVNLYMAHGGTNFGLWNGANLDPATGALKPTVTSYDYDAAIAEDGDYSPKFAAFRDVIARHTGRTPPAAPPVSPRLPPASVVVDQWCALLDRLDVFGRPITSPAPLSQEELGAGHGLVHYRGAVQIPPDGRALVLDGLADRATVLVDGLVLGVVDRNDPPPHRLTLIPRPDGRPSRIDVLVENQGRINFGPALGERKGLQAIRLADRNINGWQNLNLDLGADGFAETLWPAGAAPAQALVTADSELLAVDGSAGPVVGRTRIVVDRPADGFLAFPGWRKGFAWLNGFLLGRYWHVGPQLTLYAPAPLWRDGANELIVLELERPGSVVDLRDRPELG